MRRLLYSLIIFDCGLSAASAPLYLRYGAGPQVVVTGASLTSPIKITTATPHGFTAGQVVWCQGINGPYNADGTRKVIAVQDSTDFTIQYMNGNPADGTVNSGSFSAQLPTQLVGATCGATLPYALTAHPRLRMNGPAGSITTRMADPDGAGSQTAPRAQNGWPPWDAFGNTSTGWLAVNSVPTNYTWSGSNWPIINLGYFDAVLSMAMAWFGDNSQTNNRAGALYWIDNAERLVESLACDTSRNSCGDADGANMLSTSLPNMANAYDVMYSQLQPSDISYFTGMMLTDTTDGGTCSGSYTAGAGTVSSTVPGTIVGIGTSWTTTGGPGGGPLAAGDAIFVAGQSPWTIINVASDTSLTIRSGDNDHSPALFSSTTYQIAGPWKSGNCGMAWWQKHNNQFLNPYNHYPHGNDAELTDAFNNHNFSILGGYALLGLATADDDVRGARLAEDALNSWNDVLFALAHKYWSGPSQVDSQYIETLHYYAEEIANAAYNATGGAVNYFAGNWLQNSALFQLYAYLPTAGGSVANQWSLAYGGSNLCYSALTRVADPPAFTDVFQSINPSLSAYTNYWEQTVRGDFTPSAINTDGCLFCSMTYMHTDPGFTQTDYRSALTSAHAFITPDTLASCPTCNTNMIIDRTGFSSAADTMMDITAWTSERSSNQLTNSYTGSSNPADYRIWKNHQMLGDDVGSGTQCVAGGGGNGYTAWDNAYPTPSAGLNMAMEVGGTVNLIAAPGLGPSTDAIVLTPRYADGGTGANKNQYMYAMVDASGAYTSAVGVTRMNRHIADFKTGSQYIVVYDDVATSSGQMKRTYLHYPNNGQTGEGATTFTQGTNSISSLDGSGGAILNTAVLFPGAAGFTYTDNSNGSYTRGAGQTFRVSICAGTGTTSAGCSTTNTAAEWVTVHELSMNQSAAMPAITQPSVTALGGNGFAVQIADASYPKVLMLARQGASLTAASFTTTHAGTAQYLLAGIAPGTAAVTVGGVAVTGSPFTVTSGDTSIEFTSAAGVVNLTESAATCSITTPSLPNGTVGASYSQTIGTANCTAPIAWSISGGSWCAGLSIGSSSGIISGTPTTAQTCSFTVQAVDSVPNTASQPLSIAIGGGIAWGGTVITGRTVTIGNAVIH